MNPNYSVVIPAHDGADYIGAALASIRAQSVPPARIIVVDDGSTDATADIARAAAPGALVLCQPNAGPGAATARGLAAVDTPVVAFLDQDDLWLPDKMARQLARLTGPGAVDIVACRIRTFRGDDSAATDGPVRDGWIRSGLAMRTEVARRTGPVRGFPGHVGDMVDWLARAREAGATSACLPEVLALRRSHGGNLSGAQDRYGQAMLQVARRAMLRRSGGSGS